MAELRRLFEPIKVGRVNLENRLVMAPVTDNYAVNYYVTDCGVMVSRDGKATFLEADTVVLALGFQPSNKLAEELHGKVDSLRVIGDCREPQRIAEAIEGGFSIARQL